MSVGMSYRPKPTGEGDMQGNRTLPAVRLRVDVGAGTACPFLMAWILLRTSMKGWNRGTMQKGLGRCLFSSGQGHLCHIPYRSKFYINL